MHINKTLTNITMLGLLLILPNYVHALLNCNNLSNALKLSEKKLSFLPIKMNTIIPINEAYELKLGNDPIKGTKKLYNKMKLADKELDNKSFFVNIKNGKKNRECIIEVKRSLVTSPGYIGIFHIQSIPPASDFKSFNNHYNLNFHYKE